MNVFTCSICGHELLEVERAAKTMKYCASCYNDYQKTRRMVLKAGRVFTMVTYKRSRAKRGLPVAGFVTRVGRPLAGSTDSEFRCEVCNEKHLHLNAYDLSARLCKPCGKDFEKHRAFLEGNHHTQLTQPWYIALRNLDDDRTGHKMLDAFVTNKTRYPGDHAKMLTQHADISHMFLNKFGSPAEWYAQFGMPGPATERVCKYDNETVGCLHRYCSRQSAN